MLLPKKLEFAFCLELSVRAGAGLGDLVVVGEGMVFVSSPSGTGYSMWRVGVAESGSTREDLAPSEAVDVSGG